MLFVIAHTQSNSSLEILFIILSFHSTNRSIRFTIQITVLVLLESLCRSSHIHKQSIHALHIIHAYHVGLSLSGSQGRCDDHVHRIAQGGLASNRRQQLHCFVCDIYIFLLTADLQNLANLLGIIGVRGDDQQTIQEIHRDTVRALILGSTDGGNTAIASEDEDGSHLGLQRTVQEGEAFHIQHMCLVDEQDTRDHRGLAVVFPLSNLLVNLLTHLGLDFARISSEEGEETLLTGVDDIDVVERDRMDGLLALLELTLGTLYKLRLPMSRIYAYFFNIKWNRRVKETRWRVKRRPTSPLTAS